MAFMEFVIAFFALIALIILINFAIFIYKLCMYGKTESCCYFWLSPVEQNSEPLTEVSIPCTISAHVNSTEGLGPNRRLSELVIRDGHLVLINYSTPNGKVHVKKMSTNSNNDSASAPPYEDLPPSYTDVCTSTV